MEKEKKSVKTLKFKTNLARLIVSGEKDATWRLFDDKGLQKGDELSLLNADTGEEFARAVIVSVREKKLGDIQDADFDGHERFASKEVMLATYRGYYGDEVRPSTLVKIVKFRLEV